MHTPPGRPPGAPDPSHSHSPSPPPADLSSSVPFSSPPPFSSPASSLPLPPTDNGFSNDPRTPLPAPPPQNFSSSSHLTPPPPPFFSGMSTPPLPPPPPSFSGMSTLPLPLPLPLPPPPSPTPPPPRSDSAVISMEPDVQFHTTPPKPSPKPPPKPLFSEPTDYSNHIMALDPYSLPLPFSPEPSRPPSYFDYQKDGIGEAVFASDLISDDMEGGNSSSPFVSFSALTVPKHKKIANIASLGFGALVSPVREVNPPPPFLRNKPVRCEFCGAYANLYCPLLPRSGEWKCVFCKKGNDSKGEYLLSEGENYSSWPELSMRVVDYLEGGTRRYSSASDTALAVPVVFVIDETLDEELLRQLQKSLLDVVETLPPATRIGIVTCGRSVSVYDLNQPGVVTADVFPGTGLLSSESKSNLVYGSETYLAPLVVCLPVAKAVISGLRPYTGSEPEIERKRCLGMAVEVALTIVRGPATDLPRRPMKRTGGSSRIVVCLGGPTTSGPGSTEHPEGHSNFAYEQGKARKHMEKLGQEARRLEVAVDILFGGLCPIVVPVLLALTNSSGGVLVMHDDFGETFSANVRGALGRVVGVRGTLEVRISDSVVLTRVIGPAEVATEGPGEPQFSGDISTALEMLSVEEGQGLTLSMELAGDVTEDYVYFQFAMRYTSVNQATIIRLITVRLLTTISVSTYLSTVDEEVAAAIIGKRTILAAERAEDLHQVRRSIDERVIDLALKFGKPMARSRLRRFPNELPRLVEVLYHMRRGPLLGGSEGERLALRGLLLRAALPATLSMLRPSLLLLQAERGDTLQEVPPCDLALHSTHMLLLDHGTDVCTWMGADLAADRERSVAAQAACMEVVEVIAQNRFPCPRFLSFKEGSPASRFIVSRLVPVRKDPPSEQETRFPPFRDLSPEERNRLKSKLPPTDELSFCEWLRSLRIVPPDPYSVR